MKKSKKFKLKNTVIESSLLFLSCIFLVGLGFSSYVLPAQIEKATAGEVNVSVNNTNKILSVDEVSMFSYGPDGFTSYNEDGQAQPGTVSNTGTVDVVISINVENLRTIYPSQFTTIKLEGAGKFNIGVLNKKNVTNKLSLGTTVTPAIISLTNNNDDELKGNITISSFFKTSNPSISSEFQFNYSLNLFYNNFVTSNIKYIKFKLSFSFIYNSTDFYTDLYKGVMSNNDKNLLNLFVECSVTGVIA